MLASLQALGIFPTLLLHGLKIPLLNRQAKGLQCVTQISRQSQALDLLQVLMFRRPKMLTLNRIKPSVFNHSIQTMGQAFAQTYCADMLQPDRTRTLAALQALMFNRVKTAIPARGFMLCLIDS
jgi:hypothetical protein